MKDEKQVRNLILWLEDQKIRHYKIEDRGPLRDIDSPDWIKAFNNYCNDISSPIKSSRLVEHVEWLVTFAVRLEYSDNGKYNSSIKKGVQLIFLRDIEVS